jgi:hypothetical protein
LKFDRFELHGTEIVSGRNMLKVPSMLVENTRWQDDESVEGAWSLPGVNWAWKFDPATDAMLDMIFAGERIASLSSTWKRDLAATRMHSDVTLESAKVGRLEFRADLAGFPASTMFKSPNDWVRLMVDTAVISAELVYTDQGVTPRLFDMAAARRGVAKETLLAEAGQNIAGAIANFLPRNTVSPAQVEAFLRRPHQLRLAFPPLGTGQADAAWRRRNTGCAARFHSAVKRHDADDFAEALTGRFQRGHESGRNANVTRCTPGGSVTARNRPWTRSTGAARPSTVAVQPG